MFIRNVKQKVLVGGGEEPKLNVETYDSQKIQKALKKRQIIAREGGWKTSVPLNTPNRFVRTKMYRISIKIRRKTFYRYSVGTQQGPEWGGGV